MVLGRAGAARRPGQRPLRAGGGVFDDDASGGELIADGVGRREIAAGPSCLTGGQPVLDEHVESRVSVLVTCGDVRTPVRGKRIDACLLYTSRCV